jgi:hypothetical protein
MKILFVCIGGHFPEGAFRFLKNLHGFGTISVKGIFFSEMNIREVAAIRNPPLSEPFVKPREKARQEVETSKSRFIESCKSVGMRHTVDEIAGTWDTSYFLKETRFADLAVMSGKLISNDMIDDEPNYFIHDSLRNAECPVAAIPDAYTKMDRIIVAYDGQKESMFALKQFTHMFPDYGDLPIELVYIKDEDKEEIPEASLLKEYSMAHFDAGNMLKLHYHSPHSFNEWLKKKQNVILIAGSFSRSGVSMLLKESFVEKVIRNNSVPVFIAHNTK